MNINELIEPWNAVHTLPSSIGQDTEVSKLVRDIFSFFCQRPRSEDFDTDFNIIVDEEISADIILNNVSHNGSIKAFVLDSLKRYHALDDIMQTLTASHHKLCFQNNMDHFSRVIEQLSKHMVLVCTIESLSFESQRFLGNMIRKNNLPIPLAYYVQENDEVQFKINFNTIAEVLCYSGNRIALCAGSPSAIGLGKTSILPYIFDNIRGELLNTDGNSVLRLGCIDTLFGLREKNDPYTIFDVHGTVTTLNEDVITAIQQYCTVQILFLTETDLQPQGFLSKMMNYSVEIQNKPTIVIIFDAKYGDRTSLSLNENFKELYANQKWNNTVDITAPFVNKLASGTKFNTERCLKSLRESILNALDALVCSIKEQPVCESVFSIQAYFLATKASSNTSPCPL